MKRKITKAAAIALSMGMIMSGCNSTATPKPTAAPAPTASGDTQMQAPASSFDKELNLVVEVFDRGDYPSPSTSDNNPLTKWIIETAKKDINVNVSFLPVPRSQEYDKLNVMMAGNTAPDLVFTYNINAPANYAKNGGLTELTPYIDKFGPAIKEKLAEQLPFGVFNDGQYAIPSKRVNDDLKHATYVRTDILEKYNLPIPTTKEAFYTALKTVKENEPDMIPYAMATTAYERNYENFVMSYAKYADEKEYYTYNSDSARLVSPGAKEGFRELNKWYNEGLISTDFALDAEGKQLTADISTAKAFSFTENIGVPDAVKQAMRSIPGAKYLPTNTFENEAGEYFFNKYEPIGLYMMVPKANEKNAEAVVKYINWMLADENIVTLRTAMALGGSEFDENGIIKMKNSDELAAMGIKSTMYTDLGIVQSAYIYDDIEKFKMAQIMDARMDDFDPTDIVNAVYELRQGKGFYTIPRLKAPTDAEGKFATNIRSSIQSMAARLIVAKPEAFDALWDTEYKSLLDAGLKAVLDERAAGYDELKK